MLHLDKFIHNNDMLYVATCIATLIGAICFRTLSNIMCLSVLRIKDVNR